MIDEKRHHEFAFYRTELRTLQNTCDNEQFLQHLAEMIGKLSRENEELLAHNETLAAQLRARED